MKLLSPLAINSMTLPNRVAVPAMVTRLSGEDGFVNDDIIDRYVRYAEGQVGLIVVEAMAIHQSKSGPLLRISDDHFTPGHRQLTERVHGCSESKIVPQIITCGGGGGRRARINRAAVRRYGANMMQSRHGP